MAQPSEGESITCIINIIISSMPDSWTVYAIKEQDSPYWSFSDDKCTRLQVYGPEMGGYDYYKISNGAKMYVSTDYFSNESRIFWVASNKFDPKWTLANAIKNRLNITPVKFPRKIWSTDDYIVYGEEECAVVLRENEYKSKNTPEGANSGEPIVKAKGGSWPSWADDIKNGLMQFNERDCSQSK